MTQQPTKQAQPPAQRGPSNEAIVAFSSFAVAIFTFILTVASIAQWSVSRGALEETRKQSADTRLQSAETAKSFALATKAADAAVKQANAMAANVAVAKKQARAAADSAAAAKLALQVSQGALKALRDQASSSREVASAAKVSAVSARHSADVADTQAKAFLTVQSGELYVNDVSLSLPGIQSDHLGAPLGGFPIPYGKTPAHSFPSLTIYNSGQTDLIATHILIMWSVGTDINVGMIARHPLDLQIYVSPHATTKHWLQDAPIEIAPEAAAAIDDGRMGLYVHGTITYKNVFGEEFERGYGFMWHKIGGFSPQFQRLPDLYNGLRRIHNPARMPASGPTNP
jgi:hypothetical protein